MSAAPAHMRRYNARRIIWLAEVEPVSAELERRGALQLADEIRRTRDERIATRRTFPTAFPFRPSRRHAEVLTQALAAVRA